MTARTDVVFVIPAKLRDVYQTLAMDHATEPPAKARFAASYLLRRGVSVALIDSSVTNFDPAAMGEKVREMNPRLVVVPVYGFNPSSSTHTMPAARAFAEGVKQANPTTPIIMMGTHPAPIPKKTLETEPAVDYICAGEGPITIHELLEAIKGGGDIQDIRKVRSLWYRENGAIAHNLPAPLIDLNKEPVSLEAWRLMDPRRYVAHEWHTGWLEPKDRSPYANPYGREGCPFRCGFCNIQSPYREGERAANMTVNSYRTLRPELFVAEITYLVEEFGTRWFKIPDEMFGLGGYPLKVAGLIHDRFGDSLTFWCYYRVDTLAAHKPRDLDILRSAGFRWLGIGVESANSKVRSGQDKKFGDKDIYQVMGDVKRAGIAPAVNYIFGLWEWEGEKAFETMESMEETYRMAVALNSPFANFYCNQALPGAREYDYALRIDYPLPERSGGPGWIGHAQYSRQSEPFYPGDALTPKQILAFRDWAHMDYYTRPEYRAMILQNYGEVALRTQDVLTEGKKGLKRDLFGGRSWAELSREEQAALVPMSAR